MLETLEKAFYIIGDRVISMSAGELKKVDNREIKQENVTSELVISPRTQTVELKETEVSLNQYTKKEIVDLANERFGINLNYRLTKPTLISLYLNEQGN